MNEVPESAPSYIYLASPYGRADAMLREERYLAATGAVIWLLKRRNWVYSPIVHCHELSKIADLPKGFDYWQDYNKAMLLFARALYVLLIPGWRESDGVAGELAFAKQEGIFVRYIKQVGEAYEINTVAL